MNALDEIVERFQDAWSPGTRQRLGDFLPSDEPIRFATLVALVGIDLELSLRSGGEANPTEYLNRFPELKLCREVVVQLYTKCFKLRAESDPQLSWREYLQTVPAEWRDELQPPIRYLRTSELLGRGGQAEVWRSQDQELEREVALKVFRPDRYDERLRQRFIAEAKVIGDLEHPSIVPVYGWEVTVEGHISYAMQLLDWPTLTQQIEAYHSAETAPPRPGNEPFRKLLTHFLAVCNAAAFAHDRGYLHLDLKPGNILVGDYGETMVMDWGLTQKASPSEPRSRLAVSKSPPHTTGETEGADTNALQSTIDWRTNATPNDPLHYESGQIAGTPAYMSPEQARGETRSFSAATDVFGLGAVLYHILVNRPPYVRGAGVQDRGSPNQEPLDSFFARVESGKYSSPRKMRSSIPKPLDAICSKAMSTEPGDRYQSVQRLARDVEHWLADEPVQAYAETALEKFWRWMRRHHKRVFTIVFFALLAIAIVLAAWSVVNYQVHKTKVTGAINSLIQAESSNVPGLLAKVSQDDLAVAEMRRRLQDISQSPTPDLQQIQRYRLGLLPSDSQLLEPLLADALREGSNREFLLIRRVVARNTARPTASLLDIWWAALAQDDTQSKVVLRAAALLAAFEKDSDRWSNHGTRLAGELITLSPSEAALWTPAMLPVRESLVPPLRRVFADEQQPLARRLLAADVLSSYLANDTEMLVALIGDAHPQQHAIVFAQLANDPDEAFFALKSAVKEAAESLESATAAAEIIAASKRLTRLQAALLRFGAEYFDWRLLRTDRDPTVRTELIHYLPQCQTPASIMLDGYQTTEDAGIRAAILLCLGGYLLQQPDRQYRDQWASQLQLNELAAASRDPGLRAAASWLLRKWRAEEPIATADSAATTQHDDALGWYVTKTNGHGMVVIPKKVIGEYFTMGAINNVTEYREVGLREAAHRRRIDRHFALASRETTVAQYEAFLVDYHRHDPNMPFPVDEWMDEDRRRTFNLQNDGPAVYVNWLQAATYCNWLSRKEGLDPVYPAEVEQAAFLPQLPGDGAPDRIELPSGLLKRNGYRLPTEPEWEVACRAGSTTPRHFGFDQNRLREYAHYRSPDSVAPLSVSQLKPNAWGFFDMLGNAMEWCHHTAEYPENTGDQVFDDNAGRSDQMALRGGSCQNLPVFVRSSYRLRQSPAISAIDIGFRVVRTIPGDDPLLSRAAGMEQSLREH